MLFGEFENEDVSFTEDNNNSANDIEDDEEDEYPDIQSRIKWFKGYGGFRNKGFKQLLRRSIPLQQHHQQSVLQNGNVYRHINCDNTRLCRHLRPVQQFGGRSRTDLRRTQET